MYGMKSVTNYEGKIKGDKIKMSSKNEKSGGGMGGGFMGSPGSLNLFTVERVSNEPMNPVN